MRDLQCKQPDWVLTKKDCDMIANALVKTYGLKDQALLRFYKYSKKHQSTTTKTEGVHSTVGEKISLNSWKANYDKTEIPTILQWHGAYDVAG